MHYITFALLFLTWVCFFKKTKIMLHVHYIEFFEY